MNILFFTSDETPQQHRLFIETLATQLGKEVLYLTTEPNDWEEYTEANSIDLLCISCRNSNSRVLQHHLNACRGLRIPYLFLTDTMQKVQPLHKILMPVSMLEEEIHKAETGAHLARFTGAEILLLKAHDYGSKALRNTQRISLLLDKFALRYQVLEARKDSFHLMQETTDRQRDFLSDLILLTASRDYGLDDILFGPPERNVIRRSQVPVMLLNPRGDLYSLCD